jgi:hypothetical protein
MPLCNVAYSYLAAKMPEQAGIPAFLGMVEDAVTSGKPTETASFQNLLAANYPELPARSLGNLFVFLTRSRGLFPLYPETVLDCAIRTAAIPSPEVVAGMQQVASEFRPAAVKPSLDKLAEAWENLRPILTAPAIQKVPQHEQPAGVLSATGSNVPGGAVASVGTSPAGPGFRADFAAPSGGLTGSRSGE